MIPAPDRDALFETFNYDSGYLTRRGNKPCGYRRPDGYIYTRFKGRAYGEHRLVYYMLTGEWPEIVDHINNDRGDNRIENLRGTGHAGNSQNRTPVNPGRKGCYFCNTRKKWVAQICANGVRKTIGYFCDEEKAQNAYRIAAHTLHGEFANIGAIDV